MTQFSLFISYQEVFKYCLCHLSPFGNPEDTFLHSYIEICSWQLCATKSLKICLNRHMCTTKIEAKESLSNHKDLPSLLKCWMSAMQNTVVFYYRDVKSFHTVFQISNLYFRHRYQEGKVSSCLELQILSFVLSFNTRQNLRPDFNCFQMFLCMFLLKPLTII